MPKFMVLYRSPVTAPDMMKSVTPEEMQEGMKLWHAWMQKCGDAVVDMGSPLGEGVAVTRDGASSTDPRNGVTGYSVLQADTPDQALSLLEGHPHLTWSPDCQIDVHQLLDI